MGLISADLFRSVVGILAIASIWYGLFKVSPAAAWAVTGGVVWIDMFFCGLIDRFNNGNRHDS